MNVTQIVAPTQEPITLNEAKEFMRILESDDDTLISSMIIAAREYVENYTNRQICEATFELTNENIYNGLEFPKNPVNTISKIEYMDESGAYQTMPSGDYYSYLEHGVTKLWIDTKPTFKEHKNAFKITFTSGYIVVPETIKTYMKIIVSTIYENREFYVIGAGINTNANPLVDRMLDMFRVNTI